jgi:hypothetical protein
MLAARGISRGPARADHRLHGAAAAHIAGQEATMRTTRATLTAILVTAVVLAGCAGGEPARSAPAAAPPASSPSPSASSPAASSSPVAPVTTSSTRPFPGIWDVRTWKQAREVQQAVDDGHQPWRLDPAAVVAGYARGALGISKPAVRRGGETILAVASPDGEIVGHVKVTQPVRQGPRGIWVVTGFEPAPGGTAQASCSPATILPLLKRKFDNPAGGLVIVKADVKRCRNGYARVLAVPRQNPAGQSQYDSEQLFLRSVKGAWTSVAEGTGITCDDVDITAAMLAACRALGYRT